MPELVRMYIRNVIIGFVLALAFTGLIIGMNVANLRHLIMGDPAGWIAVVMIVVFNTIVFAGVQFGISVMRMAEPDDRPKGGKKQRVFTEPALVDMPARDSAALKAK